MKHRVVVPALGYYEWQEQEVSKQPFFVRMPGEPLALAGIVREWPDPAMAKDDPQSVRLSMAIITLDAHVTPGEVHDRELAFLTPDVIHEWLDSELGPVELFDLLNHSSEAITNEVEYFAVSRSVNKVQKSKGVPNGGPELVEPND